MNILEYIENTENIENINLNRERIIIYHTYMSMKELQGVLSHFGDLHSPSLVNNIYIVI